MRIRHVAAVAAALVCGPVTLAVSSTAAHATGAVNGAVLGIHAAGSVYGGSGSVASGFTTAGGTVTYTYDVLNKGPVQGQFLLRVDQPQPGETMTLAAGSLITTPLAQSPSGYFTAPINPGKSAVYTLKVKTATTLTQTSRYFNEITLFNTDGGYLDEVYAETEIKATSGPFIDDIYTSGNAGGPVISEPGVFSGDYSSQPIKPGQTATFTVKVRNDSQTPGALRISAGEFPACGSNTTFPFIVKVGTADVTPAVTAGTYLTATLAHNGTVTFTAVVTYPSPPVAGCFSDQLSFVAFGPDNSAAEADMQTVLAQS